MNVSSQLDRTATGPVTWPWCRDDNFPDEPVGVGNAYTASGTGSRGWFVGDFMPPDTGLRKSKNIEVKWGVHRAGECRPDTQGDTGMVSLAVLISGTFVLDFPGVHDEVKLVDEGDFVVYGPEVPHSWQALEDSVIITIRWSPTS